MHTAQARFFTESEFNLMASLRKIKKIVVRWASNYRQRRQLAKLDARMLRDIGLTREQVNIESAKNFWE